MLIIICLSIYQMPWECFIRSPVERSLLATKFCLPKLPFSFSCAVSVPRSFHLALRASNRFIQFALLPFKGRFSEKQKRQKKRKGKKEAGEFGDALGWKRKGGDGRQSSEWYYPGELDRVGQTSTTTSSSSAASDSLSDSGSIDNSRRDSPGCSPSFSSSYTPSHPGKEWSSFCLPPQKHLIGSQHDKHRKEEEEAERRKNTKKRQNMQSLFFGNENGLEKWLWVGELAADRRQKVHSFSRFSQLDCIYLRVIQLVAFHYETDILWRSSFARIARKGRLRRLEHKDRRGSYSLL